MGHMMTENGLFCLMNVLLRVSYVTVDKIVQEYKKPSGEAFPMGGKIALRREVERRLHQLRQRIPHSYLAITPLRVPDMGDWLEELSKDHSGRSVRMSVILSDPMNHYYALTAKTHVNGNKVDSIGVCVVDSLRGGGEAHLRDEVRKVADKTGIPMGFLMIPTDLQTHDKASNACGLYALLFTIYLANGLMSLPPTPEELRSLSFKELDDWEPLLRWMSGYYQHEYSNGELATLMFKASSLNVYTGLTHGNIEEHYKSLEGKRLSDVYPPFPIAPSIRETLSIYDDS